MPAGRQRWSNRRIVEDCHALDIAKLVRAGVFRTQPGVLCSISWKDPSQKEILRANCFWHRCDAGKVLLSIAFSGPDSHKQIRPLSIKIAKGQLRFGPRLWFLCPGICPNDIECRKRVRILYLTSDSNNFGCRTCLHLIHRSAREHDGRIDRLLRLSPEKLTEILISGTLMQRLLAMRATCALAVKLRRKMSKFEG
jgi:hypothetical protein